MTLMCRCRRLSSATCVGRVVVSSLIREPPLTTASPMGDARRRRCKTCERERKSRARRTNGVPVNAVPGRPLEARVSDLDFQSARRSVLR